MAHNQHGGLFAGFAYGHAGGRLKPNIGLNIRGRNANGNTGEELNVAAALRKLSGRSVPTLSACQHFVYVTAVFIIIFSIAKAHLALPKAGVKRRRLFRKRSDESSTGLGRGRSVLQS